MTVILVWWGGGGRPAADEGTQRSAVNRIVSKALGCPLLAMAPMFKITEDRDRR
jgi:carbamate kinase